ncbi:hypothetical protein SteCoe_13044 [Stentor coeruleus]|uniref:VWFA domain-containing protein n=1 Tax=Stentor coeruleus TaxID=5963 RepID=A0A1R2C9D5_9CILI|nr:hypothetical protein SteCoe_13044 [Stentor coeruleus]
MVHKSLLILTLLCLSQINIVKAQDEAEAESVNEDSTEDSVEDVEDIDTGSSGGELTEEEIEEEQDLQLAAFFAELELEEYELTTSEDLYEEAEALEDVAELMDEEDTVMISDVEYTKEEIEEWAEEIAQDAEDQAQIEDEATEALDVLDEDTITSEMLFEYAEELEDLFEIMDSDDVVIIDGDELTEEELTDYIDEVMQDAEELLQDEQEDEEERLDRIDEIVAEIEAYGDVDTLSLNELESLADLYEELLSLIEEPVEINGEVKTEEMIQQDLNQVYDNIDNLIEILDAEAVLEDGEIPTAEDYRDLRKELKEIDMSNGLIITIDGQEYDQDSLRKYLGELQELAEELQVVEDFDEEVEEAEEYANAGDDMTSEDLEEYASELIDILVLMDEDFPTVNILGVEYDENELKDYIQAIEQDAAVLADAEALAEAIEIAEDSYGGTSEELENYAEALEDIVDLLEDGEEVIILGESYTKEELEAEIEQLDTEIDLLSHEEDLEKEIADVEKILNTDDLTTSPSVYEYVLELTDVLELMEEDEEVTINGVTYNTITLQEEIDESTLEAQELEEAEILNKIASDIEQQVASYIDEEGIIYITANELEEELDLWKLLQEELDEDETVVVNDMVYDSESLEEHISELELELEKLEDQDLVIIIENGSSSYLTEEEYEYDETLSELIESAEEVWTETIISSIDLYEYAEFLEDILSMLSEDQTVVISDVEYDAESLEEEIERTIEEAKSAEHIEDLSSEAEDIENLLETYSIISKAILTADDVKDEKDEWEDLEKIMELEDTVIIMDETYTYYDVAEQINILENLIEELEENYKVQIIQDGVITIVDAEVIDSGSISSEEYIDMTTSSEDYDDDLPIILSNSQADSLISETGFDLTQVEVESDSIAFLQLETSLQETEPVEDLMREEGIEPVEDGPAGVDYHEGDKQHIILTTFINDKPDTGKVWTYSFENPDKIRSILEGFQRPTGVCYDVNHDFMYVVDKGFDSGEGFIYQYQMNRKDDYLDLANGVYVVVYTGTPSDCKVDPYGNLYLLDSAASSISFIAYADLYFGYTNAYTTYYVQNEDNTIIDSPYALDLISNEDIYFINNNPDPTVSTLNLAEAEVDEINGEDILELVEEDEAVAWGVSVAGNIVYYSLDSGEIKGYNIERKTVAVYSSDFFIAPRGLSYGDGKVYVADNGEGALYSMDYKSDSKPKLIFYAQAINSVFCVNGASGLVLALGLLLLIN